MAMIFEERDFTRIFNRHGEFFLNAIQSRGWDYLIHRNDYFIPELVVDFYGSFDVGNINLDDEIITLNWNGQNQIVDKNFIHAVTGCPRCAGAMYPLPIEEYIPLMGENCLYGEMYGIRGTSMYPNIYAVCRWLVHNVLGLSQVNTFYASTLHIAHALMTHNYNFCMCQQLFHSIVATRQKLNTEHARYALPCLVTRMCRFFMTEGQFNAYNGSHQAVNDEFLSRAYHHCGIVPWRPQLLAENILAGQASDDWWNQDEPQNIEEFIPFASLALRDQNRRIRGIEGDISRLARQRHRRGRGRGDPM